MIRYFLFFLFLSLWVQGQRRYVLFDIDTKERKVKRDSVQAANFLDSLVAKQFWGTEVLGTEEKPSEILIRYRKRAKFGKVLLDWGKGLENERNRPSETRNLDSLLQQLQDRYDEQGYAFQQLRTHYLEARQGVPRIRLELEAGTRRNIDRLEYLGQTRFPSRFRQLLERRYVGQTYQPSRIAALEKELGQHPWLILTQPPQTLFRPDSTLVVLNLKKKSRNYLDALVGFGNDQNGTFQFNGHLRVDFQNLLNRFEQISIHWERTQDRAQNFDLMLDYPYLFRTDVGVRLQTHIYRQDSAFARVQFQGGAYYQYRIQHKVGLNYTLEKSAQLQDQGSGQDYSKSGVGFQWLWEIPSREEMFITDQRLALSAEWLQALYGDQAQTQYRIHLDAQRTQRLFRRHYMTFSAGYHFATQPLVSTEAEYYRLGGWATFRGFNERSIPVLSFWRLGAEYRYLIPGQAFFSVFTEGGGLQNPFAQAANLYSFGLGLHFLSRVGIVSVQLASGQFWGQPVQWNDTKIHIGLLGRF